MDKFDCRRSATEPDGDDFGDDGDGDVFGNDDGVSF